MKIAEAREQKLATARKNLKVVVVALLVLAIEKMIDTIVTLVTTNGSDICPNQTKHDY